MPHQFINTIEPGKTINDVYLITEPILRSTTNGSLYIAMYIGDRTGQLNGRMWQATEQAFQMMPKPGFVRIQGRSELYKDNLQIVVNNFSVVQSNQIKIDDYLARTDKDVNRLFDEIKVMLGKIKNTAIREIVRAFLSDEPLMENFCKAPAAVKLHHNYLGGLIEHTHNMLNVATAILPLYPDVNADLVLAGIFIHDMGKTEELSYDIAFSYTDSGQLIGHISKTLLMLNEKARELNQQGKTIGPEITDALGHIVLAHHGQYEFGSPKLPAIPEAFMVNYIDDLDAKINQVTSLIQNEPGDTDWTSWQKSLETRIYRRAIE